VDAPNPFEAAVRAGERLKQAYAKLEEALAAEQFDSWGTLEEWQRDQQPEWNELQQAVADYHEAGSRLAASFASRFAGPS
jgi:hypothetical protein